METKLTYQDCLDLKEAGFPQEGVVSNWVCTHDKNPYSCMECEKDYTQAYSPFLEELIEACGDEFLSLDHTKLIGGTRIDQPWCAIGVRHQTTWQKPGLSPIKAVKNLYCALNKK